MPDEFSSRGSSAGRLPRQGIWTACYCVVVLAFLAAVAAYYDPATGLTTLIEFPAGNEDYELPALQAIPHAHASGPGGYDGQFYAQLALVPLLRDPAIDRAMDFPAYRARRILFSWSAWALGLGRPSWVLQAFAAQNVVFWLLLAGCLLRWFPPTGARNATLWASCLWTHGLVVSVRYALVDGPSALLITLAVIAAEANRPWLAATTIGVSGLGRETNLLAAAMLARFARLDPGTLLRLIGQSIVVVAPLALWMDYLRSIYRSQIFVGGGHIVVPFSGYSWKWERMFSAVSAEGWSEPLVMSLLTVVALTIQAAYLLSRSRWRDPWLLTGLAYLLLVLTAHPVVWDGTPGAITRVALPVTLAFNVQLAREQQWFWPWCLLGNLTVLPGIVVIVRGGL